MKLFTKDIDRLLFRQFNKGSNLDSQEVVAKIFNPYGHGRWYLLNSDPDDEDYIWAIVQMGNNVEVGSVSRSELESIRVTPFNFKLERDLGFRSVNAGELLRGLQQGKFYKKGGWVENENKEMAENQANEVKHHSEELSDALKKTDHVEAWVVGKMERATTDLSDVTHYLDGESKKMADGGETSGMEVVNYLKGVSGLRASYIAEWGDKNNVDLAQVEKGIKTKKLKPIDFSTALSGKDGNKYAKEIIEKYSQNKMAWGGKMANGGITDEKEKRIIKEYEEHIKKHYIKIKNYWRSKGDEDMVKFNNNDLNNHLSVIDDMKSGRWSIALYTWRSMDTASRDEITKDAYDLLLSKNDKMEKGGVADNYKHFELNAEGNFASNLNGKNYEVIYRDDKTQMYDLFEDGKKIKSSKYVRDVMTFANGGGIKSTNIDDELKDFNLDDLDDFEIMQFNQYYSSLGKVGALQVLINNVEGDYSQLSTELSELAEKQISNEEWDKESMRRYGYANGGYMGSGGEIDSIGKAITDEYGIDKKDGISRGEIEDVLMKNKNRLLKFDGKFAKYSNGTIPKFDKIISELKKDGWVIHDKYEDGGMMAKGGMSKKKVNFSDKVKAIQKSLLKRKKVSPKVQKDYGKTYNKKEAQESAKRIAGAMRKKEK
jgi:hypothetical protein